MSEWLVYSVYQDMMNVGMGGSIFGISGYVGEASSLDHSPTSVGEASSFDSP